MKKRTKGLITIAIAAFSTVVLAQSFTTFPYVRVQNRLDLQGTLTVNGSTGTSGQILTSQGASDPIWAPAPVTVTPANPTASLGLTAINGVANTYMRSDAAPALSQSITPTWTGTHTFANSGVGFWVQSTAPGFRMDDTDAGVDGKQWLFDINAGNFRLNARTDAGGIGATPLQINRTGTTIDSIVLSGTALTWAGTTATLTGTTINLNGNSRLAGSVQLLGATQFNSRPVGVTTAQVQIEGNNNSTSSFSIVRNNPSSGGGILTLGHSRDSVTGGVAIVNINDSLGTIDFAGADGVDLVSTAASIVAAVDASPGADDMPGRLVFNTTADGAASPTERLRISSSGAIGLSGANFGTAGQAIVSNGSASAPTWQTVAGGVTGLANPTASIGLTAVNGSATTSMRSDAAPALSQAIAPTWTNRHIFAGTGGATSSGVEIESALPMLEWDASGSAANNRRWRCYPDFEDFLCDAVTDNGGSNGIWLTVNRTGATIDRTALSGSEIELMTSGTDRLSIESDGSWNIGSSNGAAGQILTSNGAAAAPTWSNPGIAKTCTTVCDLTGLLPGQSAMIRKSNTQSVTSSTTLVGDNELAFSNAPAGGYIMVGMYEVTDGGGGVRVGFSASGVAVNGNASCGGTLQVLQVGTTNPGAMLCPTAATSIFTYQGNIRRGSAGSITVMFAQHTSNAAATTMGTNSYVMLTRYY